jgi:hypothetical protein
MNLILITTWAETEELTVKWNRVYMPQNIERTRTTPSKYRQTRMKNIND